MARRLISCQSCGASRPHAAFGITEDGFEGLPEDRALKARINVIGGRGRCEWSDDAVTIDEARAMAANLEAALTQLRAAIAEAEGD